MRDQTETRIALDEKRAIVSRARLRHNKQRARNARRFYYPKIPESSRRLDRAVGGIRVFRERQPRPGRNGAEANQESAAKLP